MSAMFDRTCLTKDCQTQTSPHFEGRCDCPQLSGMDHQSPTPPLSRHGSSVLAVYDQEVASSPVLSPLSAALDGRTLKQEDSHQFAVDLEHALKNMASYPQPVEKDPRHQYIDIRDLHSSCYENSPPQYFQYPKYQQFPSYVSYQNHPFGPPTPAPTSVLESPAMNLFPRAYAWPAQDNPRSLFDGRKDDNYQAMSPEEDGDDPNLCDKPYARLIYEALMQAPGHRMMLREIYHWFQCHTTKPAESGTNGWQNSIRHNLSMNQAFENDKSDLANATGQKQKVSSFWVLTENAIRNGVQSTTRYRKTGNGKRMNSNRMPAPLRQRSGAKGGKAARRTAQLRKKEHLQHHGNHSSTPIHHTQEPMYDYESSIYDGAESSDNLPVLDPATPLPNFSFGGEPDYPSHWYAITTNDIPPGCGSGEPACAGDLDQSMTEFGYQSTSDLTLEEMLRIHQDSPASNLSN